MSHAAMGVFQTFRWEFGKQHSVASVDPAPQGSLVLFLEVPPHLLCAPWPTLRLCSVSWGPLPLGTSPCCGGDLEKSLLDWSFCLSSGVTAL